MGDWSDLEICFDVEDPIIGSVSFADILDALKYSAGVKGKTYRCYWKGGQEIKRELVRDHGG